VLPRQRKLLRHAGARDDALDAPSLPPEPRFGRKRFGDEGYAREELGAEIGAAFLCAELGITPEVREDHAAYIDSWLAMLKNDKRAIFSAAAHAQRAVDYLPPCSSRISALITQPVVREFGFGLISHPGIPI